MKRIIIAFTLCIAALCLPAFVTAQAMEVMRQEGIASWYGPEFDGRPTASGEIFNSALLTAAHPTLPFGTIVLVTNRHNNRQVSVRINDRGPFVAGRIIDVSRAAAEQLEMLITGTAPVVVDVIRPTAQAAAPQAFTPPPAPVIVQPQVQQPAPPLYLDFVLPPVQPPPTYQPPQPVQPPVQQPLPINPPEQPLPPIQQAVQPQPPAPLPPQQPHITVTPGSADTASQGPYAPITVTIFPPPAAAAPVPVPQEIPQAAPVVIIPEAVAAIPQPLPTSGARLVPAINPEPNKTYTLQIGSFRVARNAVDTYVVLRDAGLNPEYERYNDFFRVVLKGIRGTDVQSVADSLERAGFREAVIREE